MKRKKGRRGKKQTPGGKKRKAERTRRERRLNRTSEEKELGMKKRKYRNRKGNKKETGKGKECI